LELDLDPGPAADAAGETREGIGQPCLPAVLRPERGVRAIDRPRIRENTRSCLTPLAPDASARVRRRDSRPRGMTQPLDLARLSLREDEELPVGGGEPDRGGDRGSVAPKRREAQVAVAVEIADVGHAMNLARSS